MAKTADKIEGMGNACPKNLFDGKVQPFENWLLVFYVTM